MFLYVIKKNVEAAAPSLGQHVPHSPAKLSPVVGDVLGDGAIRPPSPIRTVAEGIGIAESESTFHKRWMTVNEGSTYTPNCPVDVHLQIFVHAVEYSFILFALRDMK